MGLEHGVALPAVRAQEPIPTDGTSHADAVLAHAVEVLSAEQFEPQLNQYCKMCAFRTVCPAQPESTQVVS